MKREPVVGGRMNGRNTGRRIVGRSMSRQALVRLAERLLSGYLDLTANGVKRWSYRVLLMPDREVAK